MADEIRRNLVFLIDNLTNLTRVLAYLEQCDIISKAESEDIDAEKTPTRQNFKLLSTLQKKDWQEIKDAFLDILRKTNNDRCAQVIQGNNGSLPFPHSSSTNNTDALPQETRNPLFHPKINQKWWPEKKLLIQSLLKRRVNEKLLIDELHDRIIKDKNRIVVVCESSAASKYSGMGGVGKTLTAKWYAHNYEQEYDHIIWIDCGEGSLLTSFESLAGDLKIEHLDKLVKVQDYSRKCFNTLSAFRCLWVYDNAENYKGEDGIVNVLPKDEKNFYCIITSRSREWGTEKIGYGKISYLELDIFSEEESLNFLKCNLNVSLKYTESQLKESCRLMGNLPLALQLAAAALNNGKIELQNYIEKTSSQDLGNIIEEKFDDYEKTINKNVRISLDLILEQENGKVAHEALKLFGYIRPDNVQSIFLMKILNINLDKLQKAINLLENYSLVTKTGRVSEFPNKDGIVNKLFGRDIIMIEMDILSIHRLLQQVIRHNGRETEKKTLKKILGCIGFIDYKFIPFTKYADEKLQKQFPKVRALLLDQRQLRRLIREGRLEEAIQLARFIYGELKTKTAKFNYAVCLFRDEQKEECIKTLNQLLTDVEGKSKLTENAINTIFNLIPELVTILNEIEKKRDFKKNLKLLDLETEPTAKEIKDFLFHLNLGLGKLNQAFLIGLHLGDNTQILNILRTMVKEEKLEESVELAKIIAEELKTQTSKFNLAICLANNKQFEKRLDILKELERKVMIRTRKWSEDSVKMGMLGLNEELCRDLILGHLLVIYWKMDNRRIIKNLLENRLRFEVIPSTDLLDTLIRLVHSDVIKSNYSLVKDPLKSTIILELGGGSSIIQLRGCSLDLSSFDLLSPQELELVNVSFNRNGREVEEANLNEFCDFHKINKLNLFGDNMSIELSDDISMEYLSLVGVKVLNWKEVRWNIKRFKLIGMISFVEKTKVKVKEMCFNSSSLEISCLPSTIEKLYLFNAEVVCNESIDLPNLKYLTLERMSDSSFLSSFRSPNLTHLHFKWMKEVNVEQLPKSVSHIKITKGGSKTIVVDGVRRVDKLILEWVSFKEVEELLGHFQRDELVVDSLLTPKELIKLTKKEIKIIAVGCIQWEEEDLSVLSSHVDREADYYLWEGGRGKGMERKELEKLMKWY